MVAPSLINKIIENNDDVHIKSTKIANQSVYNLTTHIAGDMLKETIIQENKDTKFQSQKN